MRKKKLKILLMMQILKIYFT